MTLKQAIAQAQLDIAANNAQTLPVNQTPSIVPWRSYPPATASEYMPNENFPFAGPQQSLRPMWKIQESAQTQSKVLTTAALQATTVTGIAVSPTNTSAVLVAVPDMIVSSRNNASQVQVTWNISASLDNAANQASFALFRDGIQIGTTQWGNSPTNNAIFSVSQTVIDSPQLGLHSYALYWAVSAGTITANLKQRNMSAMVLRAQ